MKHFLHHLFLPRHSNNHRAKILHHTSLVSLIAVLFLSNFLLSYVHTQFEGVLGLTANISAEELLLHTNIKRQEHGLPPLSLNSQLSQAAAGKAQDMIVKNYWAHIAPDGLTPWAFIKGAGYEYIHAGENLARGFTTSSDVVNAWMASPGHRDNMLSSNFSEVGFAILPGTLTGEETVLVVEMLGSRGGFVAASPDVTAEVAIAPTATPVPALPTPTPTIAVIQQVLPTPTPTSIPTPTPSGVTPTPSELPFITPAIRVASFYSEPLVDQRSITRNTGIFIAVLLLAILVIDMVVIKRRKIVRALSHHLDQIIFFSVLIIILVIISRGSIL